MKDAGYTIEYLSQDKDWDNEVLDKKMIVVAGAGNYIINDGIIIDKHVSSPSKGFNVISVGNYSDTNNRIEDWSCYIDPQTGISKPEVSAPGRAINPSEPGENGTSFSSPHVAGFAADLLSRHSFFRLKPELFKAHLMASARKPIAGGFYKVGVGGVDFLDAVAGASIAWWRGASFNHLASHDGGSLNNKIEKVQYLRAGTSVRVVISWLNSGTYTLAHKKIGKDFNLYLFNPNGSLIAKSDSRNNSYEVINKHITQSGNYKLIVTKNTERDTNTATYLGMSINW